MPSKPKEFRSPIRATTRPTAGKRGYDYQWQKRRKAYLEDHPFCVLCGAPSRVVDHIIRKRRGGIDDDSNYQALCKVCHDRKTGKGQ